MSSIANLPILTFISTPSLASSTERPTEREIDRNALVAISPDRDELLMSKKSIDEIRQSLKLRTGPTERYVQQLNKGLAQLTVFAVADTGCTRPSNVRMSIFGMQPPVPRH
jgi:hypothetical protein